MRIILASDGSEYSFTAAGFMRRMGLWSHGDVTVLHVIKDHTLQDAADAPDVFRNAGMRGAGVMLDELAAGFSPEPASVWKVTREGEPWREIVSEAEEKGADLIVMGHRGLSGIMQFMLGSVAHKVARHSPVSTLVVRDLPILERPMRVLVCMNGSCCSRDALRFVREFPFRDDTEIHLLAVVDMEVASLPERYYPADDISRMMSELREHYRGLAMKIMEECALELGGRFGDVKSHVLVGIPEEEILKTAGELEADLVVMGSRRPTEGIMDMLFESSACRVLRHSDCSVLLVKSGEEEAGTVCL